MPALPTLRQLEYAVAVAEHASFARAARACRGADEIGDFRATSLATLVEMVSGGEGVTLLPELTLAVEADRRDLALVPFASPAPFRTIGLAWRAASGRAAEYALLAESLAPSARRARARPRRRIARPQGHPR